MGFVTREQAVSQICDLTKLGDAEVQGLLDPTLTRDDLEALVRTYRDMGAITTPSTWDEIVAILKTCSELAELLLPIFGVAAAAAAIL